MPRIEVEVESAVFQFDDLNHWKMSAADVLCVDALGRICLSGAEFMRAETEQTYPILAYPIPARKRLRLAARAKYLRDTEMIDRADQIERAFPLAGHEDQNEGIGAP